jgi:hypothetical protein
MLVNNSSRCWREYALDINRSPLPSTSDKDDWVDAEFGAVSLGEACIDQSARRFGVATGNTPDRSFPCARDATQRDPAYRLFDMTRSMQTAPSDLTSSIPCRAGAGDNCHSQEL